MAVRTGLAVLYTALALGANLGATPALAEEPTAVADTAAATGADPAALREGSMKKLAIHEAPQPVPTAELVTMEDAPASLEAYRGKWVVLNFWATWCAPCRAEMPALDRLQVAMPDLVVLPLATGRNPPEGIGRFFEEAGITRLQTLRDPKSALARQMGVLALPVTVILNPEGQEVARMIGDAEWDSDSARAVLAALMAGS
ncbi:MAG: TlpA family protein disulfide reductase [Rhodobacteraceae bacterium]|jgi:thiol-disulfide isomerase/thioredoxin|nr:TlpA family protein disulfide reductase [Paracoccaceae bacterium]